MGCNIFNWMENVCPLLESMTLALAANALLIKLSWMNSVSIFYRPDVILAMTSGLFSAIIRENKLQIKKLQCHVSLSSYRWKNSNIISYDYHIQVILCTTIIRILSLYYVELFWVTHQLLLLNIVWVKYVYWIHLTQLS